MTSPPPETCAVAFKEWAGVCDALARGRQSLILRKGGVAEGPSGFQPDHPAFWLYPTHVHEAEQGLRTPPDLLALEVPGEVAISALAVVEWTGRVDRPEQLPSIEPFHDWTEATVLKRFHYRTPGLWALAVRIYRTAAPRILPITPAHLGCKTWVPLDPSWPTEDLTPVLPDPDSIDRRDRLQLALGMSRKVDSC